MPYSSWFGFLLFALCLLMESSFTRLLYGMVGEVWSIRLMVSWATSCCLWISMGLSCQREWRSEDSLKLGIYFRFHISRFSPILCMGHPLVAVPSLMSPSSKLYAWPRSHSCGWLPHYGWCGWGQHHPGQKFLLLPLVTMALVFTKCPTEPGIHIVAHCVYFIGFNVGLKELGK